MGRRPPRAQGSPHGHQVGELLGLRQGTVEDYARRDVLPSFKLGKHRRFLRAQVEARLAELLDGAD